MKTFVAIFLVIAVTGNVILDIALDKLFYYKNGEWHLKRR